MTRIKDPSAIEARLLELAHTTDAKITAPALAYFAPCSLADANKVLDELTARDQLIMDIDDDGNVSYRMPGRQKLADKSRGSKAEASPRSGDAELLTRDASLWDKPRLAPAMVRTPSALVHVPHSHVASPLLAAVLTLFIPGAGHLYAGRVLAAILWFLVVGAGYALILPGLVLHLFAIVSAAGAAHRLNAGSERLQLAARTY